MNKVKIKKVNRQKFKFSGGNGKIKKESLNIREWKGPRKKWKLPVPPLGNRNTDSTEILADEEQFGCAILASFGFSYKCIAERVGIPTSRVAYILQKAGVKVTDYRDGVNPISNLVIERCGDKAKTLTSQRVKDYQTKRLLK